LCLKRKGRGAHHFAQTEADRAAFRFAR